MVVNKYLYPMLEFHSFFLEENGQSGLFRPVIKGLIILNCDAIEIMSDVFFYNYSAFKIWYIMENSMFGSKITCGDHQNDVFKSLSH